MSRRMRWVAGVALVGCLVLAACSSEYEGGDLGGGDTTEATSTDAGTVDGDGTDADAEADVYVEAVAATITDDGGELALDEEAADCLATVLVGLVGAEALIEAGITPEELADAESFADVDVELPDEATARLSDGFATCDITDHLVDAIVEQFTSDLGADLAPESGACLAEAVDRTALLDAIAAAYIDGSDEESDALFYDMVSVCPDVLTAIMLSGVSGTTGPEEQACLRSRGEAHTPQVRSALLDEDPDAVRELGALMITECPGIG
jgi:hypothetical protein